MLTQIRAALTTRKTSRRNFLKGLGATATVAAVAPAVLLTPTAQGLQPRPSGPVYIPPSHLEYVPRQFTQATIADLPAPLPAPQEFAFQQQDTVQMLMLKDTFYYPYGKLRQNSTVAIRTGDAQRWLAYGIAVPAPGTTQSLQPDTSRLAYEASLGANTFDATQQTDPHANVRRRNRYTNTQNRARDQEYEFKYNFMTPDRGTDSFEKTVHDEFAAIVEARKHARAQGIARPALYNAINDAPLGPGGLRE
jgi:hypothetical protein